MVFIQELGLARTRKRSCISLVDTLNSLIVNRFICYAKEQTMIRSSKRTSLKDKQKDLSKGPSQ